MLKGDELIEVLKDCWETVPDSRLGLQINSCGWPWRWRIPIDLRDLEARSEEEQQTEHND